MIYADLRRAQLLLPTPLRLRAHLPSGLLRPDVDNYGRSGEIRTPDPLLPKQVRYQAALHSVWLKVTYIDKRLWSRNQRVAKGLRLLIWKSAPAGDISKGRRRTLRVKR